MAKRKLTRHDWIRRASKAHSDLHIAYAVIAMMESGLLSSNRNAFSFRVIEACKREAQKCLREYDKAITEAEK